MTNRDPGRALVASVAKVPPARLVASTADPPQEPHEPPDEVNLDGHWPQPIVVQVGAQRLPAHAHGSRFGRRGPELLVDLYGRLTWIRADHVRPCPATLDCDRRAEQRPLPLDRENADDELAT
jgi:hypothetical protein